MTLVSLAILALIQGITEFLPISSSGHLILFPQLTGSADQGVLIDVAVHVGTLAAVVLYFRREVGRAALGGVHILTGRTGTAEAKLAFLLGVSTVPVVVAGVVLSAADLSEALRSAEVIAWSTLVFGVVLWAADRWGPVRREAEDWTLRDAMLMGLAQVLALIPGTSRSGITMTAARGLGYARVEAARLSMLMSVPTILAAGALATLELAESGDARLGADMAIGAGLAFVSALAALTVMMRWLQDRDMTPFVLYRLALGIGLLIWVYG